MRKVDKLPGPPTAAEPAPTSSRVSVISPDDQVGTIDASDLNNALDEGYKPATPENLASLQDKQQYGKGVVNELEAGALGFLRGSTFGLSDLAMRKFTPDWADDAAKLKQYNPNASLAGEIGSFVVPAIGAAKALGTAGKVAQSTGMLQQLVSKGAGGLGEVASKIVGDNLAGKAIGAGAKLGAEAAVYQAAHNLSENALQDKDLTAESILAGTGQAAILGAGIGAAIPLVAHGAQSVAKRAMDFGPAKSLANKAEDFFDPDRSRQLFSGAMQKELNPETGARFQSGVSELADSGLYARGKVALDPNTAKFVQTAEGGLPSQAEVQARVKTLTPEVGKAIGNITKDADAATNAARDVVADATKWTEADQSALMTKVNEWRSNAQISVSEADRFEKEIGRIATKVDEKAGSLEMLHKLRKGLDARVGGKFGTIGSEEIELVKSARAVVGQKIEAGLQAAAQDGLVAPEMVEQWQGLNRLYGNLKSISNPLSRAVGRAESNVNVLGLRFRDIGIGAVSGGVLGGPAGVAAAVANRAAQTDRGLLFRAEIGDRLQKLAWAEKLTQDGQKTIADGLRGFLTNANSAKVASEGVKKLGAPIDYAIAQRALPKERTDNQQRWFEDTRTALMTAMRDPQTFAAQQGAQLQGLADHAPGVADAVLQKQLQVYSYLLQTMPKNPGVPLSIANDHWKPADYQVQDFRRVVQVARAPLTIMQDLKTGNVSQRQVDAVKTLYPKIYDSILTQVQALVNAPDTKVTYQQQLKLGRLFPGVIPTMQPGFVAAMQQPNTKPKEPAVKGGGAPTMANRMQTESDRLEAR